MNKYTEMALVTLGLTFIIALIIYEIAFYTYFIVSFPLALVISTSLVFIWGLLILAIKLLDL